MRQRKKNKSVPLNPLYMEGYKVLMNPNSVIENRKRLKEQDEAFAAEMVKQVKRYDTDPEYKRRIDEETEKESARQRQ